MVKWNRVGSLNLCLLLLAGLIQSASAGDKVGPTQEAGSKPATAGSGEAATPPVEDSCKEYSIGSALEVLREFAAEGSILRLVIGRTANEEANDSLPSLADATLWVFGDKQKPKGAAEPKGVGLVLDFDNPDCLKKIDSDLFTQIIFDGSTWRFFKNSQAVLSHLSRILKKGGALILERPNAPRALVEMHVGSEIMYIDEPIPHHYSLPTEIIDSPQKVPAAKLLACARIDQIYQEKFASLGFSSVTLHTSEKYPIPTHYYPTGKTNFYEFIK